MHSLEPVPLAALAGEDRAALSGRPRKANAGQYEIVLHQGPYESVLHQGHYEIVMQQPPGLDLPQCQLDQRLCRRITRYIFAPQHAFDHVARCRLGMPKLCKHFNRVARCCHEFAFRADRPTRSRLGSRRCWSHAEFAHKRIDLSFEFNADGFRRALADFRQRLQHAVITRGDRFRDLCEGKLQRAQCLAIANALDGGEEFKEGAIGG